MKFHPVNPSTMPTPGALVLLVYGDPCNLLTSDWTRTGNDTCKVSDSNVLLYGESFGYALAVLIVDKDGFGRTYPKHFQHAFLSAPPKPGRHAVVNGMTVVLTYEIPINTVAQWAYVNQHHETATAGEGLELT